jgi:hypothetical protein
MGNGTDSTGPVEVSGTAVWPHDDALCDNPTSWDVHYEYANGVSVHYTGSGPGFEGVTTKCQQDPTGALL